MGSSSAKKNMNKVVPPRGKAASVDKKGAANNGQDERDGLLGPRKEQDQAFEHSMNIKARVIALVLFSFFLGGFLSFASDVRNARIDVEAILKAPISETNEKVLEQQDVIDHDKHVKEQEELDKEQEELDKEDNAEKAIELAEEMEEEERESEAQEAEEEDQEAHIESVLSAKPILEFANETFVEQKAKRWAGDHYAPKWMLNEESKTYKVPTAKQRDDGSLLGRPVAKRTCPIYPGPGLRGGMHQFLYTTLPASRQCLDMNILFTEGPRVGSSTLGGIIRRLAGRNLLQCAACDFKKAVFAREPRVVASHTYADPVRIVDLSRSKDVFKMAFFRNPETRCASNFRDRMSRAHNLHSKEFLAYARKECNNRMFQYYDFDYPPSRDAMDFFGVTERMEESLIVLAHMLGLTLGDIVFRGSARVGDPSLDPYSTATGQKDPYVAEFFRSEEWKENVAGLDYAYWRGANKRLDEYIARIGETLVAEQVQNLRDHNAALHSGCTEPKPCIWGTSACGYPCLDMYSVDNHLFDKQLDDPLWKPILVSPSTKFHQRSRDD